MSSIVADELAKIKSFETEAEKRRSELTLNELNYISDKQLHKKGSGSGVEFDFLAKIIGEGESSELLIGDFQTFLDKWNAEESKVCTGVIAETTSQVFTLSARVTSASDNYILFSVIMPSPGEYVLTWYPDNTLTFGIDTGGEA